MENQPITEAGASETLAPGRVYAMAAFCLVVGLAIGYLLGTPQGRTTAQQVVKAAAPADLPKTSVLGATPTTHAPSLNAMKQMADKQAAPLAEKLRSDPKNVALLTQLGAIYHATHQFQQAAGYFEKALAVDPKNGPVRTKLAISLYRGGDVDGAIAQLTRTLLDHSNDANALFNLGMINFEGKGDAQGALAAWRQLIKSNPQLSAEQKATVEKLMAAAQAKLNSQPERGKR